MRETLHRLTVALALPVSVVAVWMIRGEPAQSAEREFATAYRVELAELPLPTRARLRAPAGETAWRAPRVIPEDPAARRRRALLPNASAPPPPVAFAPEPDSAIGIADAPSTRPAVEPPDATPRPHALRAAPVLASPGVASRRGYPLSATATASAPAAPGATERSELETPAKSASEARMAGGRAQSIASKPVVKDSAIAAPGSTSKPGRIAALQAALAPSPGELKPIRSPGPVSIADSGKNLWKYSPIAGFAKNGPITGPARSFALATGRAEGEESRNTGFESASGREPLTGSGPSKNIAYDLSLGPDAFEPSAALPDLPLPEIESAAAPQAVAFEPEDFTPAPVLRWFNSSPMTLQMIPEPGSALLLGAALAAIGTARRSRRRASQ